VYGDAATLGKGVDERSAYNHAFEALKSGDYVESSRRFRDFLAVFPGGQYAPNAQYWLGESYYVTQNYALAGDQFQSLLDRFPTHDKAPGALLKLGLSQYGLKQYPPPRRPCARSCSAIRIPTWRAPRTTACVRCNSPAPVKLGP
jgi:tol-pal system protein YbgF